MSAVPISCFLDTTLPVLPGTLPVSSVWKNCIPLTASHWQWWAFVSLSVLSSNARLNNWSLQLILSALQESEANIWNLFVRNKINDIFSGVLACTCTYKSPPRGQVMNKFNQEQEVEGSFGSAPAEGPSKKDSTDVPCRQFAQSCSLPPNNEQCAALGLLGPAGFKRTHPACSVRLGQGVLISWSPLPSGVLHPCWELIPALLLEKHSPEGHFCCL